MQQTLSDAVVSAAYEQSGHHLLGLHFAHLMLRLSETDSPQLARAAEQLCQAAAEGHVCLHLNAPDLLAKSDPQGSLEIDPEELLKNKVVGKPGEYCPMILDGNRLYLYRYWRYEENIAAHLRSRAQKQLTFINRDLLPNHLATLFASEGESVFAPRAAAFAALTHALCIVTGGPGTGKTTTVARILALLILHAQTPPRIACAAPTGKAAARMAEALQKAAADISQKLSGLALPRDATTLHRLLGVSPRGDACLYHADSPLPYDIVVVDEASMIDVALMAQLLDATPPACRLILLGDCNQLASVEVGSVLGDVCPPEALDRFTPAFVESYDAISDSQPDHPLTKGDNPFGDTIIGLKRTYRFNQAIAAAAAAINSGNAVHAIKLLSAPRASEAAWIDMPSDGDSAALQAAIMAGYHQYLKSETLDALFARYAEFRVLCALRSGPRGIHAVNSAIERTLKCAGAAFAGEIWYPRRPVIITRNDHAQRLYNGDTGIAFPDPEAGGAIRVFFQRADGKPRAIAPGRLPEHETAFAMTIHKSQGSEFAAALLLLPATPHPLLSRELLYTALTRAKSHVQIWGPREALVSGIEKKVARSSGLREKLWNAET
jgi:exodeoxyribonuclease V alpha subunit